MSVNILQGDSGGKVISFEGEVIGRWEEKSRMNLCLILNGYRDTAV